MPFNYPVTEIFYPTGDRKCVFSAEEYAVKIADGWSDTPPASQEFNTDAPMDLNVAYALQAIKGAMEAYSVPEFELMQAEAAEPPAPAKHRKGRK